MCPKCKNKFYNIPNDNKDSTEISKQEIKTDQDQTTLEEATK